VRVPVAAVCVTVAVVTQAICAATQTVGAVAVGNLELFKRRRLSQTAQAEADFGGGSRPTGIAAVEDDVLHLLAAEALRTLLPQHPRDGVRHVALATAIGADDRGHALVEGQLGSLGERFET
jgi:hypothetical protein